MYYLLLIMYAQHQVVLDCKLGVHGLSQVYGPRHPIHSTWNISRIYNNIFTRFTNSNRFGICCQC